MILRLASVAVLVMTLGLQLLDCPDPDPDAITDCQSCIPNVYVSSSAMFASVTLFPRPTDIQIDRHFVGRQLSSTQPRNMIP